MRENDTKYLQDVLQSMISRVSTQAREGAESKDLRLV